MKICVIARITFAGFLRNRILILFAAVFLCVLLPNLVPLLLLRSATRHTAGPVSPVLGDLSDMLTLVGGFGSLLAAWLAADAVASDMKSGVILAVMARPVRRWEYLLGKYLGVQCLLAIYVLFTFAFSYLLAWIGGERIQTSAWVLFAYPLCRYAIYSAMAMFFVTFLHQVAAFGVVLVTFILPFLLRPGDNRLAFLPGAVRTTAYVLLPSTGLLSEDKFLAITRTSLNKITWDVHAVAVAYGLDYALVFFLLAIWSFRRRSLSRE
jgi:ABC-type transport system involved in multi-copper enzyme maturation permease subunit